MHKRLLRTITRHIKNSPINEHRTNVALYKFAPCVLPESFVHPSATLCGEVVTSMTSQVWANCVLRGDMNAVHVDQDVVILENCSLSTVPSILNSGEVARMYVGQKTIIGPNCSLVSCTIGSECFIGAGSVICEGAKIDNGSFIGPGSVVPPNRYIPAGQLWAGSPARYVKTLDKPDKIAFFDLRIQYNAKLTKYVAEYTDANSAYLESEVLNEQQGLYSEYNPQQAEERFHERE